MQAAGECQSGHGCRDGAARIFGILICVRLGLPARSPPLLVWSILGSCKISWRSTPLNSNAAKTINIKS
eukprot:11527481-Karenia_brevis.AAC.1